MKEMKQDNEGEELKDKGMQYFTEAIMKQYTTNEWKSNRIKTFNTHYLR